MASESGVPSTRVATGIAVAVFDEYQFLLTLVSPVTLGPGTYWIEIYNDTTADADDNFRWESGTLDPTNGIAGFADSATTPGNVWVPNTTGRDLSLELIMWCNCPYHERIGNDNICSAVGFGSIYYLRRKRIES